MSWLCPLRGKEERQATWTPFNRTPAQRVRGTISPNVILEIMHVEKKKKKKKSNWLQFAAQFTSALLSSVMSLQSTLVYNDG